MDAHDRITWGPQIAYWHDGSPPSVDVGYSSRDFCSHSAIVHGNRHTPNYWQYTTANYNHWKGQETNINITGHPDWSYERQGCFECFNLTFAPWERTAIYNQALENFNEKVRGGLDIGASLAESGQVLRMFRGLREAEALAQVAGRGASRHVADGWLQFQYGWKPLFGDLYGAAVESTNVVLNLLKKVRGYSSRSLWDQVSEPGLFADGVFKVKRNMSGKASCTIQCEIELPGFSWDRFSSLNPSSLAWEVIPYSFVIDWVVNIGQFLRAFETACTYNARFKSGFVSELYRGRVDCHVNDSIVSGIYQRVAAGYASARNTQFLRTPLTQYPMPRTPTFDAKLGWQRWLSAGSLIRQRLNHPNTVWHPPPGIPHW